MPFYALYIEANMLREWNYRGRKNILMFFSMMILWKNTGNRTIPTVEKQRPIRFVTVNYELLRLRDVTVCFIDRSGLTIRLDSVRSDRKRAVLITTYRRGLVTVAGLSIVLYL